MMHLGKASLQYNSTFQRSMPITSWRSIQMEKIGYNFVPVLGLRLGLTSIYSPNTIYRTFLDGYIKDFLIKLVNYKLEKNLSGNYRIHYYIPLLILVFQRQFSFDLGDIIQVKKLDIKGTYTRILRYRIVLTTIYYVSNLDFSVLAGQCIRHFLEYISNVIRTYWKFFTLSIPNSFNF